MENTETKQKFVELRAKGNSFQSIAETLGVSKQTLINWSKELKLEIKNLKALEYDQLISKFQLNKLKRLELYKKLLDRMEKEIDTRDLSEVKTDKLIELYFKTLSNINAEIEPVELEKEAVWELSPQTSVWEA